MLKKFLLFIALWLPTAIFSQNIGWVYQHMPSELSPILNASQRFELVEYAKEGKQETITNQLRGNSHIMAYNEGQNYLKVSQTANSTLSIKLIPTHENHYFIIMIHTVSAPIQSSTISVYDASWKRKEIILPTFQTSDFLSLHHPLSQEEQDNLSPIFVSADFSPSFETIVFTNQTIHILSEEQQERYKPYLQSYMIPLTQFLP